MSSDGLLLAFGARFTVSLSSVFDSGIKDGRDFAISELVSDVPEADAMRSRSTSSMLKTVEPMLEPQKLHTHMNMYAYRHMYTRVFVYCVNTRMLGLG